jgi:hypothetical protein
MLSIRSLILAFALAAVLLLPGCGASTATVSGEVTWEGEPVANGFITFTPVDGKGKDGGAPIQSGRYTVRDLPPGPKLVQVIATRKVNFASTSEEMKQRAAAARGRGDHTGLVDPADVIPANAEGNNVQVEVAAGSSTRNFHLKKPVAAPR